MKKYICTFISFIITAVAAAGMFYLLDHVVMGHNDYNDVGSLVSTGIGGGLAGILGPSIGNKLHRITSRKKN